MKRLRLSWFAVLFFILVHYFSRYEIAHLKVCQMQRGHLFFFFCFWHIVSWRGAEKAYNLFACAVLSTCAQACLNSFSCFHKKNLLFRISKRHALRFSWQVVFAFTLLLLLCLLYSVYGVCVRLLLPFIHAHWQCGKTALDKAKQCYQTDRRAEVVALLENWKQCNFAARLKINFCASVPGV